MIYGFLAILTGILLVFTTTFNSKVGALKSVYISSFLNFLVGAVTSLTVFLILYKGTNINFDFSQWFILTGGLFASVIVIISNYTIAKIGVFFVTLLAVIGQLIMGITIDWIRVGNYPTWTTIGGTFIISGLLYIHIMELKEKKKVED